VLEGGNGEAALKWLADGMRGPPLAARPARYSTKFGNRTLAGADVDSIITVLKKPVMDRFTFARELRAGPRVS